MTPRCSFVHVVVVKEKEIFVGSQCPEVRWSFSFGFVNNITDVDHSLKTQRTSEVPALLLILLSMNALECIFQRINSSLKGMKVFALCSLHSRNNMLVKHINEAENFYLHSSNVMVNEARLTGLAFLTRENTHVGEKIDVLLRCQCADRINTRVNSPYPVVGEHLLVGFVVVITIEDNLPVQVESISGDFSNFRSAFDLVCEFFEGVGGKRVEDGVNHRHVLRGSHSAELESMSSVWEWRGTVAILSRNIERSNAFDTEIKFFGVRFVWLHITVLE
mmetsp:Transcript_26999/g.65594  ORF Transcript_26999/g.65594 Transcript_26999/m.65594 type:complete len:276 (+) Transcript_26999:255-1082(+)